MHDALAVRGIEGIGHGECDVNEDRDLHRAASEPLLERLAFEQLHRDERWIGADIVDGADIRVVERGGRPRFPLETIKRLRRRGDSVRQNFDGHHPLETRVRGPIHFAHPAGTERADDFVGTESSAGSKGQLPRLRHRLPQLNRIALGSARRANSPFGYVSGSTSTVMPARRSCATIASRLRTRKLSMKTCSARPKYFVVAANGWNAVGPAVCCHGSWP